jgi:UDP-GlcNAc:undecaprenyl-phosphate GlcNAc-1-phosphate transferase
MCAVCVGFLPLNWHPAKLFMGDSGSMLVGLMFAVTAISVTGGIEPTQFFAINTTGNYTRASFAPAFLPLLLPVVILIVPVLDFTLAILRRLSAGKSPFTADRKHLHHRLLDMGHSHLHATLIFYALTAVISAGSLLFYLVSPPIVAWSVIAGGLLVCAVATLLPLSSRKRGEQSTQTRPIQILTPTSAALDPLDKAAAESNPSVK